MIIQHTVSVSPLVLHGMVCDRWSRGYWCPLWQCLPAYKLLCVHTRVHLKLYVSCVEARKKIACVDAKYLTWLKRELNCASGLWAARDESTWDPCNYQWGINFFCCNSRAVIGFGVRCLQKCLARVRQIDQLFPCQKTCASMCEEKIPFLNNCPLFLVLSRKRKCRRSRLQRVLCLRAAYPPRSSHRNSSSQIRKTQRIKWECRKYKRWGGEQTRCPLCNYKVIQLTAIYFESVVTNGLSIQAHSKGVQLCRRGFAIFGLNN